jgi:hypothetical protein
MIFGSEYGKLIKFFYDLQVSRILFSEVFFTMMKDLYRKEAPKIVDVFHNIIAIIGIKLLGVEIP